MRNVVVAAGAGVVLVLLLLPAGGLSGMLSLVDGGSPPVVLITIEGTRADHVGPCYGYDRETMPELCGLAADGVLFEEAYTQGSWTPVAIPPLLTGMLPNSVGMPNWNHTMNRSVETVAETLQDRGYTTIGTTDNMAVKGFDQGFDRTKCCIHGRDLDILQPLGPTTEPPRFSWVFMRQWAHRPYAPPEEFRAWDDVPLSHEELLDETGIDGLADLADRYGEQSLVDLYDGEVRAADATIGDLIDRLKAEGRYDDALIIVTADHGEWLGEDGEYDHGGLPTDAVSRVPLVVKFPDNRYAGTRVSEPVSHIDIVPTIHDVVGVSRDVHGASLRPVIEGEAGGREPVTAALPTWGWSMRSGDRKLVIKNVDTACMEGSDVATRLYDMAGERNETVDISADEPNVTAQLRSGLCSAYQRGMTDRYPPGRPELTAEVKERLRRMGYLQ